MTLFQMMLKTHQWLYETTDGLVGHSLFGTPTLLLRTTGAKTGRPRTSALVYLRDGDEWIVVASKGGSPTAPAWLYNLRAQPNVEVQVGRARTAVIATELSPDHPRYADLWKRINELNGGRFDAYQAMTKRPIPVVALAPRS